MGARGPIFSAALEIPSVAYLRVMLDWSPHRTWPTIKLLKRGTAHDQAFAGAARGLCVGHRNGF
jgi:hypothetical protein